MQQLHSILLHCKLIDAVETVVASHCYLVPTNSRRHSLVAQAIANHYFCPSRSRLFAAVMPRNQMNRQPLVFPQLCDVQLPTIPARLHHSDLQSQGAVLGMQAQPTKFLMEPNAVDAEGLSKAALAIFMLLEPWYQANKSYAPLIVRLD